jgi:dolichol-phosphate mannosyltransferase
MAGPNPREIGCWALTDPSEQDVVPEFLCTREGDVAQGSPFNPAVSSVVIDSRKLAVDSPKTLAIGSCRLFLSIILPAYNEEAAIEQVIVEHVEVLATLRELIADWEIVCVDDASSDCTLSILERLSSRVSGLVVVRHGENKGIYQSFADGFAAARGTHFYATGGDGQWPATNLLRMLRAVVAGADLVIGVRLNKGQVYGVKRRFVSYAFNALTRAVFGVKTLDAGSIKLGTRDLFRFQIISCSPFAEAERIVIAQRCGYRVDFVPVEFRVRGGGKATGARWSNVVASARDCLKCVTYYEVLRRGSARPPVERCG